MKKLFIALSLLLSVGGVATISASVSSSDATVQASKETYNVEAYTNPNASVKVRGHFTVTWDGDECYVVARDGKYFDYPIRCSYSRTYPGYPYCFKLGSQTWYFSL